MTQFPVVQISKAQVLMVIEIYDFCSLIVCPFVAFTVVFLVTNNITLEFIKVY